MSMSEEEALKNYDQFLRWFGWGAFAILATLPVFLYLTLYVLPYLIFGSLVVVAVFAVGFGRSAGQWEHAKFGAWLNATRLSILPVIVLMDSGALIAWLASTRSLRSRVCVCPFQVGKPFFFPSCSSRTSPSYPGSRGPSSDAAGMWRFDTLGATARKSSGRSEPG